jgi:hypothetical protein
MVERSDEEQMLRTRIFSSFTPRSLLKVQHFRPTQYILGLRSAAMSTISDAIIKDHRELEQYYNEVINNNDHDHQIRYGNQFTWELARHSVGEELVVYPAFEKYLGKEGHEMAETDRKEHHKVSRHSCPCI